MLRAAVYNGIMLYTLSHVMVTPVVYFNSGM